MHMISFHFMQRAFAAGIVTALLASVMGVFIVLRRMSMVGDSLSHAALAGVAGGMLFGIYPFYGALIFSGLSAILIEIIIMSRYDTATRLPNKYDIRSALKDLPRLISTTARPMPPDMTTARATSEYFLKADLMISMRIADSPENIRAP